MKILTSAEILLLLMSLSAVSVHVNRKGTTQSTVWCRLKFVQIFFLRDIKEVRGNFSDVVLIFHNAKIAQISFDSLHFHVILCLQALGRTFRMFLCRVVIVFTIKINLLLRRRNLSIHVYFKMESLWKICCPWKTVFYKGHFLKLHISRSLGTRMHNLESDKQTAIVYVLKRLMYDWEELN